MGLALVSIARLIDLEPAALFEKDAARYCKLSLAELRRLATAGVIISRRHSGRVRRIYLRRDLDQYLESLERVS